MSESSTATATTADKERCGIFKTCHTKIPALCITLQIIFVTGLVAVLAYLIVTHFLVN